VRRINRKLLIGGALLLVIAAAAWWWVSTWNHVSTDDAQVDGHIVPVSSKIYSNVTEVMVNDNEQSAGPDFGASRSRDYQAN